MRTAKERQVYIDAINNFVPPPGYWEKVEANRLAHIAYLESPESHDGNCHCGRCMAEFSAYLATPKEDNPDGN